MKLPDTFKQDLAAQRDALENTNFVVIVWGSGRGAGANYDKRVQIRDYLQRVLKGATVKIPEDPEFAEMTEVLGPRVAEAHQANAANAVVALITSEGPLVEVATYQDIIYGKALVFLPEKHAKGDGFPSTAYYGIKTEPYTSSEFETCERIRGCARNFCQYMRDRLANGP